MVERGRGRRPQSLVTKPLQKEGHAMACDTHTRVQWRVPDGPAFHLPDVSVTVMRPPSLCLLTPSCPPLSPQCLLHVLHSLALELYLSDLWKVGRAVTSSCRQYTVQMSACGEKRVRGSRGVGGGFD